MKKKILFLIESFAGGGVEKVFIDLINNMDISKYDITVMSIWDYGVRKKDLRKDVKYKSIFPNIRGISRVFHNFVEKSDGSLLYKLGIREKYDIEIAFIEGRATKIIGASNNPNSRKIAWVHNDISLVFGNNFKAKIKRQVDRKIYSKYDKIIFVSRDNLKKFRKQYPDLRNANLEPIKKDVIYNYLNKDMVIQKSNEKLDVTFDKETLNFVTVARLVPQKAIDRLIDVHTKLIKNGFIHNFYVVGEGPEQRKLEEKIIKNGVQNTFHLLGKKENPYPYMKAADYFCLLSQFEGYGMVLEEAKILGKEILITDTAAREAVENYKQAYIVPNNFDGIYETLKNVISKGKNKSNEKVSNEYDNSKIIEKVEKLFVQ